MGKIIGGVYYKDDEAPAVKSGNLNTAQINYNNKLDRMGEDFAHELVQPYKPDGTPNEDFMELYPNSEQTKYMKGE